MRHTALITVLLAATALSGCDLFGESAEKIAAAKEAEGKAVGGACRHAGRAIEDCYSLNRKADKAAVFAGWRDMNDYMRENKIEAVAPQVVAARSEPKAAEAKAEAKAGAEPAADGAEKKPAKTGAAKTREPKAADR
ncbi:MAG: hypothetical protein H7Y33_00020 [Cytophagales bacterium]|nr:hypothetical protein [Rhizobacter sp.]